MAGRPSKFTAELANTICERIADGESLREICADDGMPDRSTVRLWLSQNTEFSTQYAHARTEQADVYAERIVHEAFTSEDASLGRLRMDALKWAASKLAPKKYGDAVQMKHTDAEGGPVQQVIRWAQMASEATPDPSKS